MCRDFFFALSSILMGTVCQERVKCTHTKCVEIPFSLLSLSQQASLNKREWTREWTEHIHNVCEFFLFSFLYLDGHHPSRENEVRAHAHTHTHNVWVSFISLSAILIDIIHQWRVKETHTQCGGVPSSLFPLSWQTSSIKREWRTYIVVPSILTNIVCQK